MNTSRRIFLKKSFVTLAGSTLFGNSVFAFAKKKEIVGIQLYSVRDEMKLNPLSTLNQLAKMGYRHVEHANYVDRKFYGYSALEFKKILSDLGIKMPSGHTVMRKQHWDETRKEFTNEWKNTIEDAAIVGQQYVISPSMEERFRTNYDDLKRFLDVFNRCGELCKKSGMQFGYHNHDFEFSQKLNGQSMYDIILESTDPKLVIQQLDTGNLFNGGATALDIVTKFPGRFTSMHVKDEILSSASGEKYESTVLGTGVAQVKKVIDIGRKSGGTVHFIIEQEAYQGKSPIVCAKENLSQVKAWGY
jgi:sugar phosphate isomerase/epimerase